MERLERLLVMGLEIWEMVMERPGRLLVMEMGLGSLVLETYLQRNSSSAQSGSVLRPIPASKSSGLKQALSVINILFLMLVVHGPLWVWASRMSKDSVGSL
jgi:hypothetical protein